MQPLVSIVMPNMNTEKKVLIDSIQSILNQSYTNFEFIIIDDGSIDDYDFIRNTFSDPRIRLYKNDVNIGISKTLNRAISLANGKYIFRMDADDKSLKFRLKYQIRILERNENIDILGSSILIFGNLRKFKIYPKNHTDISSSLLYICPFAHPSVAFRADTINTYKLKYDEKSIAEDYDMWVRCMTDYNLTFRNTLLPILKYRVHSTQITKSKQEKLNEDTRRLRKSISNHWGYEISDNELDLLNQFCTGSFHFTTESLNEIEAIIHKLETEILKKSKQLHKSFIAQSRQKLFKELYKAAANGNLIEGIESKSQLLKKKYIYLTLIKMRRKKSRGSKK